MFSFAGLHMVAPSRKLFSTRFRAFAKVESSLLVSSVVQWPEVRSEVRSSPDCECGLDPLQAPQKQNLNELRFLQPTASPHLQRKRAAFCDPYTRKGGGRGSET